ncbi:type II toxin-antitoxin system prevent-host-death family antitoxin [Rhizobium sp. RU36D]|uniref:type II toxin-antitoxin system Phd/YefM family antitoxin n=1 Tax=Rhizobium sp. RU36D TaxID=1907415 RepID=UPI0009D87B32|nr:type II toxin-antitoxin system prevent-host-death family antitoxin [Rhizobium sp. RU36D]SMC99843.1 prevent-host-death family protein [Rhizobium sp. RU36D]
MTMSVRDVKSDLSELVDEVIKGGSVTITRDGKPVATLVPVESAAVDVVAQKPKLNLIDHLKAFPEPGMVFERNRSPSRDVDL